MTITEHPETLKLLLAENIAVSDRHTAQFKQLQNSVKQLLAIANQQAAAIDLLLHQQAEVKANTAAMQAQQAEMDSKLDRIREML